MVQRIWPLVFVGPHSNLKNRPTPMQIRQIGSARRTPSTRKSYSIPGAPRPVGTIGSYGKENKLKIDLTGLYALIDWLGTIQQAVADPKALTQGVQQIGFSLDSVWRDEGEESPWKPLTGRTVRVRRERWGDDRATNPILQQSGGLYDAAVKPLMSFRGGSAEYTSDAAYDGSDSTHFTASATTSGRGQRFTATLTGAKVANQYGGSIEGEDGQMHALPARPFFYIPNNDFATDIVDGVEYAWSLKAAGLTSSKFFVHQSPIDFSTRFGMARRGRPFGSGALGGIL